MVSPDEKENPEVPDVEKVLEEMDNDPKGDNCYDKYNLWNKAKDYQCCFVITSVTFPGLSF